ncbi:MAG: serine/threonine protein kinase [Acidobacteria bacterium]|nr:serine/threonine protein kinase [Acidobacteriota bacterium]
MPEPENMPSSIGRYEVKRLLGGGAMGFVWLAEDPRIKRKVAVKTMRLDIIRNDADRHECLARFQREAEVSGLLNHPGIVTIYDVGESELGPFLAMEFVPGRPLDALIKSGREMPLREKLRLLAAVAEALDHAHSHGIVHRDVKPGNVMVTEDGRPKLMDFGIAKREDASLTQTGTFLGTPSYASPEQIREGAVDNRSDIFSFGVMTFELLSGVSPFPGNSINTILYKIVNEPPVEVQPPVLGVLPEGWRRVFHKVLAKLPGDRHPSCAAFVRDLMEVTTDMAKEERRELLGLLNVPGGDPVLPPILSKAHEETVLVQTAIRRKGKGGWMIAAAAVLALAGGGAWMFLRGRGGDTITLKTEPDKARILVDGKEVGLSPASVTLKAGARLRVERKGFKPFEMPYDPARAPGLVTLEHQVAEVRIESIPDGASVVLDGKELPDRTPVTVSWDLGKRTPLTLTKGDLSFTLDYETGESPQGQILQLVPRGASPRSLDAGTEGILKLNGSFPVRVRVDGQDLGELGASAQHPLAPGKHKVELSAPKYFFRETRTITVQAGQTATLNLPPTARLTVETFPGTGMVTIDGQATDVESTGDKAITLAAGTHVVGFAGKGTKQSVEVRGDQKVRIKL